MDQHELDGVRDEALFAGSDNAFYKLCFQSKILRATWVGGADGHVAGWGTSHACPDWGTTQMLAFVRQTGAITPIHVDRVQGLVHSIGCVFQLNVPAPGEPTLCKRCAHPR